MTSDNKTPQTLTATRIELIPTPRADLKTLDDVRLEMARVYRDMRTGKIDPADGTKLAFVLANIGKLIEADVKAGITSTDGKRLPVPTLGDFYRTVGIAKAQKEL